MNFTPSTRPRLLRPLAITLIAISFLACNAFVASIWFMFSANLNHASIVCQKGRMMLMWHDPPIPTFPVNTFSIGPVWFAAIKMPWSAKDTLGLTDFSKGSSEVKIPRFELPPQVQRMSGITFPIWTLAALSLPGFILLYFPRPRQPNHCPHCRYNCEGLPPNSPCPECGKPSTQVALVHNSSNARGGK